MSLDITFLPDSLLSMMRVLLTYSWVRSSYTALRNMKFHGIDVYVTDSVRFGMCRLSRFKKGFNLYPDPRKGEIGFIDELVRLCEENKVAVLLPSHDETIVIAKHRDRFKNCAIPVPSVEKLAIANDKELSRKQAEVVGVAVARNYVYTSPEEIMVNTGSPGGLQRFVIRLRRSNSAKGVFYANGGQEVVAAVKTLIADYHLQPDRYPVVQDYVEGEGWGVSCLYWEGRRIAHFTHRRLREKTETGGTSTLREHQPNQILEEMAFKLLDKMQWHGLAMVEFKYNPETKQAWFIEINPRLWGSIHLAISAGVEFPWLLYLCATEGPESAILALSQACPERGRNVEGRYQKSAIIKYPWKARWYLGDLILAASCFRHGRIIKGLKLILPGGCNTYDDLRWDDPMAFVGEVLHYAFGFIRSGSTNPVEEGMVG